MSPSQLERIAALETIMKVGKVVVPIMGTAILAALGWAWHISNSVTAIQQQLADGGNAKLVSALSTPASKQQLAANLQLVTARIAQARATDKKPDPIKVEALSAAVSKVLATQPDIPEAWDAAYSLVSFRSEENPFPSKSLPTCAEPQGGERAINQLRGSVALNDPGPFGYHVHDCTLDFDDVEPVMKQANQFFAVLDQLRPGTPHTIRVSNVQVLLSGQSKIPAVIFLFENCRFNLEPPHDLPSPRARVLASDLLAATSEPFTVNLTNIAGA